MKNIYPILLLSFSLSSWAQDYRLELQQEWSKLEQKTASLEVTTAAPQVPDNEIYDLEQIFGNGDSNSDKVKMKKSAPKRKRSSNIESVDLNDLEKEMGL